MGRFKAHASAGGLCVMVDGRLLDSRHVTSGAEEATKLLQRVHEIGDDVMLGLFFRLLDAPSLAKCCASCRFWQRGAGDPGLWEQLCRQLWENKVYVPVWIQRRRSSGDPQAAYGLSILDAQRTHVTMEELIGFDWHFRFKASAGDFWTTVDPWHNAEQPWRASFEPPVTYDSNLASTADFSFCGPLLFLDADGRALFDVEWSFVTKTPIGLVRKGLRTEDAPLGSFVRAKVRNMEVPSYVVDRHKNWGFTMESCWVVFTSFPMPPKNADVTLQDDALRVDFAAQEEEVEDYQSQAIEEEIANLDDELANDQGPALENNNDNDDRHHHESDDEGVRHLREHFFF